MSITCQDDGNSIKHGTSHDDHPRPKAMGGSRYMHSGTIYGYGYSMNEGFVRGELERNEVRGGLPKRECDSRRPDILYAVGLINRNYIGGGGEERSSLLLS